MAPLAAALVPQLARHTGDKTDRCWPNRHRTMNKRGGKEPLDLPRLLTARLRVTIVGVTL
jgi:hypothetical protein